jgi:hypothetical protein
MKKETKDKLKITYWIIINSLAIIGILGLLRYMIYGAFY